MGNLDILWIKTNRRTQWFPWFHKRGSKKGSTNLGQDGARLRSHRKNKEKKYKIQRNPRKYNL